MDAYEKVEKYGIEAGDTLVFSFVERTAFGLPHEKMMVSDVMKCPYQKNNNYSYTYFRCCEVCPGMILLKDLESGYANCFGVSISNNSTEKPFAFTDVIKSYTISLDDLIKELEE